jgi:hypothetical protein
MLVRQGTVRAAIDALSDWGIPLNRPNVGLFSDVVAEAVHDIHRPMSDQGSDDDQIAQRMDAMLLRLLKTPPQSRAEVAEAVRRAKEEKPTRTRAKRASAGKPAPAA